MKRYLILVIDSENRKVILEAHADTIDITATANNDYFNKVITAGSKALKLSKPNLNELMPKKKKKVK